MLPYKIKQEIPNGQSNSLDELLILRKLLLDHSWSTRFQLIHTNPLSCFKHVPRSTESSADTLEDWSEALWWSGFEGCPRANPNPFPPRQPFRSWIRCSLGSIHNRRNYSGPHRRCDRGPTIRSLWTCCSQRSMQLWLAMYMAVWPLLDLCRG